MMVLLSISCSTTSYKEVYPLLTDGKYDSEFPYRKCSEQIEKIAESVRMVSCVVYYKSLLLPLEAKIRYRDIQNQSYESKASKEVYLNRTASGSATIIFCENDRIALMTCAHVVDFPDTIVTYYRGDDRRETEFIQSIAVKEREHYYIASIPAASNLEIIAFDRVNDLALIGQRIHGQLLPTVTAFSYPFGRAKELEWGAFVYLFGYPNGWQIVTKGIVSNPNRDKKGSFLTDAVSGRGFSGGIVIAVRDGVPNFELVGITALLPGTQQYFMTPTKNGDDVDYKDGVPFKDDLFVAKHVDIIYGISPTISAETIIDFLEANRKQLDDKGYYLKSLLERHRR